MSAIPALSQVINMDAKAVKIVNENIQNFFSNPDREPTFVQLDGIKLRMAVFEIWVFKNLDLSSQLGLL